MAKAVFRPGELMLVQETVTIETPVYFTPFPDIAGKEVEVEIEPEAERYFGPSADDLRREAEEFAARWELEKEAMIDSAKAEAESITREAELSAERERLLAREQADSATAGAREEAERILGEAREQAEKLDAETRGAVDGIRAEAVRQGTETGREEGYAAGMAEVERLIGRTRVVLERAQDKRGEILADTEREIVDLVLLVTRKVVKAISETNREIVISNVVQALRKVKDRGNIIIRVNLSDLKLTTDHTQNFIKMLEGAKSIQVAEDSSVDPGGCVIETDFGEIDARISSQLAEMEARILQVSPMKSKAKAPAGPGR